MVFLQRLLKKITVVYLSLFLVATITNPVCTCSLFNDDDGPDLAPLDCVDIKPDFGNLEITLTINSQNPSVPITIYDGDFEKNQVVLRDTLTTGFVTFVLPIDKYYAVTALYLKGADTVLVIDADDVEADRTDYDDKSCYTPDDGVVDLRLKK